MKGASLSVCLHEFCKEASEKKPFCPAWSHFTRKPHSVDKHPSASDIVADSTAKGLARLLSDKSPLKHSPWSTWLKKKRKKKGGFPTAMRQSISTHTICDTPWGASSEMFSTLCKPLFNTQAFSNQNLNQTSTLEWLVAEARMSPMANVPSLCSRCPHENCALLRLWPPCPAFCLSDLWRPADEVC